MQKRIRVAPSLGSLEEPFEVAWNIPLYNEKTDRDFPTVFVGMYGLKDFYTLLRHRDIKWILWCGTDILHFDNGYWIDSKGEKRVDPQPFAKWIQKNCYSYVENVVEQKLLKKWGIKSKVIPSFIGNIHKFDVHYTQSDKPKLYSSVSNNEFEKYGWYRIQEIADYHPNVEFHLYGNTLPFPESHNVIVHGRVPKEQMNSEIQEMQGAIRLVEFDGFSEIIAKSLLMAQWPVSIIPYRYTLSIDQLHLYKELDLPNIKGREYYQRKLNKYPWL